MSGRPRWLAIAAVALVAGYAVMLAVWPESRPSVPRLSALWPSDRPGASAADHRPPQGTFEEIPCELVIPSAAECDPLEGCPATRLGTIFGVSFSNPHGLCVASVDPDGAAAQAGVQPGDRLADPSQCPSGMIGMFLPGDEARTVEIVIRRSKPKEAEATGQGTAERPQ